MAVEPRSPSSSPVRKAKITVWWGLGPLRCIASAIPNAIATPAALSENPLKMESGPEPRFPTPR